MRPGRLRLVFRIAILSAFLAPACIRGAAPEAGDLIARGDASERLGNPAEALGAFEAANSEDPGNAEILRRIAKQYSDLMSGATGKAEKLALGEKALDAALRAVAADPKNGRAQAALAVSYGRLALLKDTRTKISYAKRIREHALRASELNPGDPLAWQILGSWSLEMANLGGVARTFASLLYGDLPAATNEEALACFRKAAAIDPDRIGVRVGLGRTYAAMGRAAEARRELEAALDLPDRGREDPGFKAQAREVLKQLR